MEEVTQTNASKHWEAKKVDPRNIVVVEGFNVRQDFGDLEELMLDILENGLVIPLLCRKRPGTSDTWELVDGERRYRAIMMAIERGHEIPYVKVNPFVGTDEDRIIAMAVTGTAQKKFSPLEQSELVRRLVNLEWSVEKIAKKLTKSVPTIYELLELSKAPEAVKKEVEQGNISARTVAQVVKKADGDSTVVTNTVKAAVEKVRSSTPQGEKARKATSRDVEALQKPVDFTMENKFNELISHLRESGIENEKTELIRNIVINIKELPVEKLALFF